MQHNPLLEAALRYAARGWRVVPLHSIRNGVCTCSKAAECNSPAKHPRTLNGLKDASSDPKQIERWWTQWRDANIGVLAGESSGLTIIDVDPRNGGDQSLAAISHLLPETLTVQTGGGGLHLYFSHVDGLRNSADKLGAGIDIKTTGGTVVAPPSHHFSGGYYRWLNEDAPIASLPDTIVKRLLSPPPALVTMPQTLRTAGAGSRYGMVALERNCQAIATAPAGQQNSTLNACAYSIGRLVGGGELSPDYALRSLCHAGLAMPPSGKPWTLETVLGVVRRALAAGAAKPKKITQIKSPFAEGL